jgi:hypothetical protein
MKYPTSQELAAFERSLPKGLPKGAGRKAMSYRSISLATTSTAINKRRRKYGLAQISSKSARRKSIV